MSNIEVPPAEWRKLAHGVYAFLQQPSFGVSNSGLIVGKKDATVVDSLANKHMVENFIGKIKEVTDKPIRFIINTHHHPDHTFTNHFFPEATAITSHRCRQELINYFPYIERIKHLHNAKVDHEGSKLTPQDVTFEGTLNLYDGEREIRIIDMGPAHCQSDIIVYLPEEKIIFAGDILTIGMYPSCVEKFWSGSYRIIKVLDTLASMDAETFVPGHGKGVLSREETAKRVSESIEFLIVLREEARKCFEKGMTSEEAFEKLDWSKFKKWGEKEKLGVIISGNLATIFSEFSGAPPGTNVEHKGWMKSVS